MYLVSNILVDVVLMVPTIVAVAALYILFPDKIAQVGLMTFVLLGISTMTFSYAVTSKLKTPAAVQIVLSMLSICLFGSKYRHISFADSYHSWHYR